MLLAPHEQARPSAYPGVLGGDGPKTMMLFDIANDPSEQRDVSAKHPDVVQRLKAIYDRTLAEVPEFKRPKRVPGRRYLKGGKLKYDETLR